MAPHKNFEKLSKQSQVAVKRSIDRIRRNWVLGQNPLSHWIADGKLLPRKQDENGKTLSEAERSPKEWRYSYIQKLARLSDLSEGRLLDVRKEFKVVLVAKGKDGQPLDTADIDEVIQRFKSKGDEFLPDDTDEEHEALVLAKKRPASANSSSVVKAPKRARPSSNQQASNPTSGLSISGNQTQTAPRTRVSAVRTGPAVTHHSSSAVVNTAPEIPASGINSPLTVPYPMGKGKVQPPIQSSSNNAAPLPLHPMLPLRHQSHFTQGQRPDGWQNQNQHPQNLPSPASTTNSPYSNAGYNPSNRYARPAPPPQNAAHSKATAYLDSTVCSEGASGSDTDLDLKIEEQEAVLKLIQLKKKQRKDQKRIPEACAAVSTDDGKLWTT
ncbi:hypothetical protein BU16DRAFT_589506 [Lophium mytilinum]|uniref:Uncharacterized protein n=1 Tax=Lophium mytilinum TaxID=390894 RepID=A0A6A6QQW9_9PEZI|nr:hypothetical protein BU16DRAFT_589506 [Lophium mytilinum]